jgi:L-threonylcarbamoyladenylate synthase
MHKRIKTVKTEWLTEAVKVLSEGGLIIYPTETSYGLGADATNPAAIERLLAYKGNRLNKALSVAVADRAMAEEYIVMNPSAKQVFISLLPGPVTVVAASRGKVAPKVESERQTLGIRYSSLPLVSELVRAFGKPVTATSANTSGTKQIFGYEEWQRYVPVSRQEMIGLFVDGGKLPVKAPSTVVDTTLDNPEVLRQGELVLSKSGTHWQSTSAAETIALGKKLMEQQSDLLAVGPFLIALQGELGAGKTHFVKGVAEALGITETVNSPTYTIMHEFPYETVKIKGVLYHIDTWRLFENEGVKDLALEKRLGPGAVVAIEWQQKAREWIESLPRPLMIAWVDIQTVSETKRKVVIGWERKEA